MSGIYYFEKVLPPNFENHLCKCLRRICFKVLLAEIGKIND